MRRPASRRLLVLALLASVVLAGQPPAHSRPSGDEDDVTWTSITAWPAELEDEAAGVEVDAWPQVDTPLKVQIQPGQTVRLDAEPPPDGLDAEGRRWRFTGWQILERGAETGWTPAPDPADPTVATFTASLQGPPSALPMVFEPVPEPVPEATEATPAGPVYSAMLQAPKPAPAQGAQGAQGSDVKGFAVGSSPISAGQLDTMKRMGASWVRFDLSWKRAQATAGGPYQWDRSDRFIRAIRAIRA